MEFLRRSFRRSSRVRATAQHSSEAEIPVGPLDNGSVVPQQQQPLSPHKSSLTNCGPGARLPHSRRAARLRQGGQLHNHHHHHQSAAANNHANLKQQAAHPDSPAPERSSHIAATVKNTVRRLLRRTKSHRDAPAPAPAPVASQPPPPPAPAKPAAEPSPRVTLRSTNHANGQPLPQQQQPRPVTTPAHPQQLQQPAVVLRNSNALEPPSDKQQHLHGHHNHNHSHGHQKVVRQSSSARPHQKPAPTSRHQVRAARVLGRPDGQRAPRKHPLTQFGSVVPRFTSRLIL